MRAGPVHVALGADPKRGAIVRAELGDVGGRAGLLARELVARERKDAKALRAVLVVERGQLLVVVVGLASVARHVGDEHDAVFQRSELERCAAAEALALERVERGRVHDII